MTRTKFSFFCFLLHEQLPPANQSNAVYTEAARKRGGAAHTATSVGTFGSDEKSIANLAVHHS